VGPRQRPRLAALSGSQPKAPGSAGGYLLTVPGGRHAVWTNEENEIVFGFLTRHGVLTESSHGK